MHNILNITNKGKVLSRGINCDIAAMGYPLPNDLVARVMIEYGKYSYDNVARIGVRAAIPHLLVSSEVLELPPYTYINTTARGGPLVNTYTGYKCVNKREMGDKFDIIALTKIEHLKAVANLENYTDRSLFAFYLEEFCQLSESTFVMPNVEPGPRPTLRVDEILRKLEEDAVCKAQGWMEYHEVLSSAERRELEKYGYACETIANVRNPRFTTLVRN